MRQAARCKGTQRPCTSESTTQHSSSTAPHAYYTYFSSLFQGRIARMGSGFQAVRSHAYTRCWDLSSAPLLCFRRNAQPEGDSHTHIVFCSFLCNPHPPPAGGPRRTPRAAQPDLRKPPRRVARGFFPEKLRKRPENNRKSVQGTAPHFGGGRIETGIFWCYTKRHILYGIPAEGPPNRMEA